MASVVNMNARMLARKLVNLRSINSLRAISTSEKKKDGAAITQPAAASKEIDFTKPLSQNWVSYGFHRTDEKQDLDMMHSFFFFSITLCFMVGGLFYAYFPDFKSRDWSNRESFLELRRREQLGLPLVDKNYIDPSKIILPTDEELGDREIII